MAYHVSMRPLNADKKQGLDVGLWFGVGAFYHHETRFPNKFQAVLFEGDYDYYGLFTKSELMVLACQYATQNELPDAFCEYTKQIDTGQKSVHWMDKHHYQLLDYLADFQDDDVFHIDATFWESGDD